MAIKSVKPVMVQLDVELFDAMERDRATDGMSRAAYIRESIRRGIGVRTVDGVNVSRWQGMAP